MSPIRPHPTHPGWYHLDYYEDGKRIRDTCMSYTEAVQLEASIKKVKPAQQLHPKIKDIADDYLAWVKDNQRPATYDKRSLCLRRMLPWLGECRIKDITLVLVERHTMGRSKHTVYDEIMTLKALAIWAKKRNYGSELVELEFRKPESKVKPTPNPADIITAINSCKKDSIRTMLQLMVYTGLRWKEVRLLRWEDYRNGELRIAEPKTTEAILGLPMPIKEWFEANYKPSGYVFTSYNMKPYYKLGNFFRSLEKKTGIKLSSHLLRHAGSIYLEEQTNGNVYAVNQFLRHKSLATTATYLRKYSAAKRLQSAVTVMDYMAAHQLTNSQSISKTE